MAVRDTRFGGNLERANIGIRSLPERNLIEDRMNYGYGQIFNDQKGARDVSGYMLDDDYVNPNVFSRQMAVEGFPNAPREIANLYNFGGPFSSPANLRESINYFNAIKNNPNLINPMYADLYPDMFNKNLPMADLYKSKEEQMEDAGSFEALQMDRYARENPFLQMLKGTQTTDVTDPRGNVTTTEEIVDPGVYAMSPAELSYMYGANNPGPMTTRLDQFYPDEQFLPNPYTPPSDRQPNLFTEEQTMPALPPENIGMDRAPNEALSEIFGSYQPPIDPTQEYYEDPIMTLGMEDLRKNAGFRMAGDTTNNMAGELMRNGIDTRGLNSDEIMQLYNLNFGNPDADVDQFGVADLDDDNAAVQSLAAQGYSLAEIDAIMTARPMSA